MVSLHHFGSYMYFLATHSHPIEEKIQTYTFSDLLLPSSLCNPLYLKSLLLLNWVKWNSWIGKEVALGPSTTWYGGWQLLHRVNSGDLTLLSSFWYSHNEIQNTFVTGHVSLSLVTGFTLQTFDFRAAFLSAFPFLSAVICLKQVPSVCLNIHILKYWLLWCPL